MDEAKRKGTRILIESDQETEQLNFQAEYEEIDDLLSTMLEACGSILEEVAVKEALKGNGEMFAALSEVYHGMRRAFGTILNLPENEVKECGLTIKDLTKVVNFSHTTRPQGRPIRGAERRCELGSKN
jgi:nitrate reductase assembly molybdenum cofactor insertion protein NarJ